MARAVRTGKGKRVFMKTDYMGATKQLPFLIAEVAELLPDLDIHVWTSDVDGFETNRTLSRDLYTLDPNLVNRLSFNSPSSMDLKVSLAPFRRDEGLFTRCEGDLFKPEQKDLYLWVDPLKYESRPLVNEAIRDGFRRQFGITNQRVIVAGSIHSWYELEPVCQAARYAIDRHPSSPLKILIVPRTKYQVGGYHDNKSLRTLSNQYRMEFAFENHREAASATAIIVNTQGILADLYSIADTTIIGKSLFSGEGQNPIEPALYGNRLIGGPEVGSDNCNILAYRGLRKSKLLSRVTTQNGLNRVLAQVPEPARLEAARQSAAAFLRSQRGTAKEYAERIQEALYG